MKKFQFNLQKVLEVRELREKIALQNYQKELAELNKLRRELLEIEQLISVNIKKVKIAKHSYEPAFLIQVENFVNQLRKLKFLQQEKICSQLNIVEQALEKWRVKHQEKLLLQKMRQKKWQQYLQEVEKEEQKTQDDLNLAKFIRERQ